MLLFCCPGGGGGGGGGGGLKSVPLQRVYDYLWNSPNCK